MLNRKIIFGGREQELRLTSGDAKALKKRFGFGDGAADWLLKDVLGLRLDIVSNAAGDIEAQHVTLAAALTRAYPRHPATEVQVERWWDELLGDISDGKAEKGAAKAILWELFACAHDAGWPTGQPKNVDDADHAGLKRLFFAETVEEMLLQAKQQTETPTSTSAPPSSATTVLAADNP